ncbi:hypothetical protein HPB47_002773 [Ixodes persulcatus]|uniref:Uncharacterized protein n=1 Tax=Ixodes persulcatus TaxID=34615 RepID=A0AC60PKG1_IXOPE|nr:hypothetical protein HPB47_002773 [Ixodes persulcatus]
MDSAISDMVMAFALLDMDMVSPIMVTITPMGSMASTTRLSSRRSVALCEAEKSCNQDDDKAESVEDCEDRAESAEDGESSTVPLPLASPVILLDMGVQVSSGDFGENFSRVVNKENVCSFTGLPNMELLTVLEKLVSDTTPTSTRAYLSAKDKIVMTMMALKHALTFDFMSQIFGVCTDHSEHHLA